MTLDKLIQRFETRKPQDADFEHPLSRDIVEELAQCKESDLQKKLFDDVRKLADSIIEQYVGLDREDKLKMAEAYQSEKCFKKIGGTTNKTKLMKNLGKSNLNFLFHISNYSKLIPILENFVKYIEENTGFNDMRNPHLTYYLCNHNIKGEKVKRQSKESVRSFYNYDFRNNRQFKKWSAQSALESITFGIPEELKQKVLDAQTLLPLRIRILEKYVKYIEENEELNIKNSSLSCYLINHNIKGEKVKSASKESMQSFYQYDFRNSKAFKKKNPKSLLESITFGVPEELKQKVIDAQSLLPQRTKILEKYVKYIEENEELSNKNSSLSYYLRNHNIKGQKVKYQSAESTRQFYTCDFRNNRQFKKWSAQSALESITFGIPEELKQKVLDAQTLLPLRIRILEKYVKYIEENEELKAINSSLTYYLCNYNIKGEKVKPKSKESMQSFYQYDFRNSKAFKKKDPKSLLESITSGIKDQELIEKVRMYALAA